MMVMMAIVILMVMVMMEMEMEMEMEMVMEMVMVMVTAPEALRQVYWLRERQCQSTHRLRAFYWPKLPKTQSFPSA
jgi:hypothetical protein